MTAESNRGADGTFVCVWRDPPEPTSERLAPGGDIYAALSADGALTPGSTLYHPLFVGVRFHAPIAGGALTASRDPAPPPGTMGPSASVGVAESTTAHSG